MPTGNAGTPVTTEERRGGGWEIRGGHFQELALGLHHFKIKPQVHGDAKKVTEILLLMGRNARREAIFTALLDPSEEGVPPPPPPTKTGATLEKGKISKLFAE